MCSHGVHRKLKSKMSKDDYFRSQAVTSSFTCFAGNKVCCFDFQGIFKVFLYWNLHKIDPKIYDMKIFC